MNQQQFYINNKWVDPIAPGNTLGVINPASEKEIARISIGAGADLDAAVIAARQVFESWSRTGKAERLTLLGRLVEVYESRREEMAQTISSEMGSPILMADRAQAGSGASHLRAFIAALESYEFVQPFSAESPGTSIIHEPIGVCGLITPWNWPMNQVALKVGAALAAGCTVILKPSEIAPLSSMLFAEFIHEAGFPAGVFNLVNGDGVGVGSAMSAHPDIDMISFTGSTRAGIAVSKAAADTVKRVALELGGKSPNLVFEDADLEKAVVAGVRFCFDNTGQSCNSPTRMLVERGGYDKAVLIAKRVAGETRVGQPSEQGNHLGPLVSKQQFDKVQALIQAAIDEGATLVAGGTGKPPGFETGYFVKPTVFSDVNNDMTIAQEEVFGPVLAMIPFDDEDDAVRMANDTPYGLAAYIQTGDSERASRVSGRLRAGMVQVNGASRPTGSPFGGYKQSGIGREGGFWGIEDFLEVKLLVQ